MGETMDLLVVGGAWGTGRRAGGVSKLICAVLEDRGKMDPDDDPKYSTFARIGSGLSFADYVWVRSRPWKEWDPKNPPEFLLTAKKGSDDKGDVYLEPEDSFILKVKAAEITTSDQYHMGCTLRFPRAIGIRDDLSIADCATASSVMEARTGERKRKLEADTGLATKKRKTTATAKKATVLPEYQGPDLRKVAVTGDIFKGMKFVVMSDPKSRTGDQDKKELMKEIHANGGTCAQIARDQPNMYVVYGGSVTPYDLKLVIDKGKLDVLKPEWVKDSIERGQLAPFHKKYFFHATETRRNTDEYEAEVSEEEDTGANNGDDSVTEESESENAPRPSGSSAAKQEEKVKEEEDEALMSGPLAEWFKVGKEDHTPSPPEDSETENDSDNEDVDGPEEGEGPNLEDWFSVRREDGVEELNTVASSTAQSEPQDEDVKMGETDDAMEYDTELIFRHLCFYLDSPDNARNHGMTVKSKHEKEIAKSFVEVEKLIKENGGKVTNDLSAPKLTHVVIDKRDDSRRLELMKRTSKPKRRHLVISEFVSACVEEATLLDEEEFAP